MRPFPVNKMRRFIGKMHKALGAAEKLTFKQEANMSWRDKNADEIMENKASHESRSGVARSGVLNKPT